MTTIPLPSGAWSENRFLVSVLGAVQSAGWSRWSSGDTHDTVSRTMRRGTPRLERDIVAEIEQAGVGRAPPRPRFGPQTVLDPAMGALLRKQEKVLRRHDARLLDLAFSLGLAHLDSCTDRIDFLVATGVLCRVTRPAGVYLVPGWPTPLPQDRLCLTLNERLTEDRLRWNDLFGETTDKIIWLLHPNADRLAALNTTIEQIARRWGIEVETVRHALLVLLDDDDFTATADLSRVGPHTQFHLAVDWNTFDLTRLAIDPESE
ncbi:MAG: DUF6042 family protein [Frankia sp.]